VKTTRSPLPALDVPLRGTPRLGLFTATLAFFAGLTTIVFYGVAGPQFKELLGLTGGQLGLLLASPHLSKALLRIPFGAWVDQIGGRVPFLVLLAASAVGLGGVAIALTPIGLFYLVNVAAGHSRGQIQATSRGMGGPAAKAIGAIVGAKSIWALLVLLAMIPGVGPTLDVLLWPFRVAASAAVMVAWVVACTVAVVTPLVPIRDSRLVGQHVADAKQLAKRHGFVLVEAAVWLGVVIAVAAAFLNYFLAQEVAVAAFATGEYAIQLYGGAPTWIRGLMTVSMIDNPFAMDAGEGTSWYAALLSILLVGLHLLVVCVVLGTVVAVLVRPLRPLIYTLAHLDQVEQKGTGS